MNKSVPATQWNSRCDRHNGRSPGGHLTQLSVQGGHEMTPNVRAGIKWMNLERRSLLTEGQQGQKQRGNEHRGANNVPAVDIAFVLYCFASF